MKPTSKIKACSLISPPAKIIRPESFYVVWGTTTANLRNYEEMNPPRIFMRTIVHEICAYYIPQNISLYRVGELYLTNLPQNFSWYAPVEKTIH